MSINVKAVISRWKLAFYPLTKVKSAGYPKFENGSNATNNIEGFL